MTAPIKPRICLFLTTRRLLLAAILTCLTFTVLALELKKNLFDFIQERFGSSAVERLQNWEKLANSSADLPIQEKLTQVNTFFNQTPFLSDQEHWGKNDYWASPIELLATNGADCEDYSIAKYFTLREMGVPSDSMKITYVQATQLNQAHMILAYYPEPNAEPLILDNLINEIRPASARTDLVPVYSFNAEGLWLAKLRGQEGKYLGNADKLKSWLDLVTRHHKLVD